jgi:hypothetical protein
VAVLWWCYLWCYYGVIMVLLWCYVDMDKKHEKPLSVATGCSVRSVMIVLWWCYGGLMVVLWWCYEV